MKNNKTQTPQMSENKTEIEVSGINFNRVSSLSTKVVKFINDFYCSEVVDFIEIKWGWSAHTTEKYFMLTVNNLSEINLFLVKFLEMKSQWKKSFINKTFHFLKCLRRVNILVLWRWFSAWLVFKWLEIYEPRNLIWYWKASKMRLKNIENFSIIYLPIRRHSFSKVS